MACPRISASSVRILICNLVVLGLLLYRDVVTLGRNPRQAVAAAAQEKCSCKEHGGDNGTESGKIRAFHGTTRIVA